MLSILCLLPRPHHAHTSARLSRTAHNTACTPPQTAYVRYLSPSKLIVSSHCFPARKRKCRAKPGTNISSFLFFNNLAGQLFAHIFEKYGLLACPPTLDFLKGLAGHLRDEFPHDEKIWNAHQGKVIRRFHLIPFRTEKLSPAAPMVLHYHVGE